MEEWTAGVYCLLLFFVFLDLLASFCVMNDESSAFLMWPWWLLCGYAVMQRGGCFVFLDLLQVCTV